MCLGLAWIRSCDRSTVGLFRSSLCTFHFTASCRSLQMFGDGFESPLASPLLKSQQLASSTLLSSTAAGTISDATATLLGLEDIEKISAFYTQR